MEAVPLRRKRDQLQAISRRTSGQDRELAAVVQRLATIDNQVQEGWLTFLGTSDIAAVEIKDASELPHYRGDHIRELGVRPVACLLSSDAHTASEVASDKRTYLRLGGLSFSEVTAALSDPETRIRLQAEDHSGRGIIRGIRFSNTAGSDGRGFFRDVSFGFSENLTCIIGPRGSGKSALIEALRFALELELRGGADTKKDAEKRREATLGNTDVHVVLEPPSIRPVAIAAALGASRLVRDLDGDGASLTDTFARAFPIDVYGWSEVEQLGRDTKAQRDLLDGADTNVHALTNKIIEAQQALTNNRNGAVASIQTYNALKKATENLQVLRHQMAEMDKPELIAVLKEVDAARERVRNVDRIATELRTAVAPIARAQAEARSELGRTLGEWVGHLHDALEAPELVPESLRSVDFGQLVTRLVTAVSDGEQAVVAISARLSAARSEAGKQVEAAEQQVTAALASAFASDIEDGKTSIEELEATAAKRSELRERILALSEQETKLQAEKERLKSILRVRREELEPAFVNAQRELSRFRAERAATITAGLTEFASAAPVEVSLVELGDRTAFEKKLYDPESGTGYLSSSGIHAFKAREIAHKLASRLLPWDFAYAIRKGETETIHETFASDREGDPATDTAKLLAHLSPRAAAGQSYDPERLGRLLAIGEVAVDDKPVIKLDGTPIEDLSPGQRCTALLPIILSGGDWPVIIDQPEDNLDNSMVFSVVVDVLRKLKDRRQVIVATHNPNIPVSGDAEQVIVLNAEGRSQGLLVHHGAIDRHYIIENVKQIMEGGEEAFKLRARKYGFDLRENAAHSSRAIA
jgi:ABC-type Mn2+/Zn2+ transport system ATPase subunit